MVSVEQHNDVVSKNEDVGNNYSWLTYNDIKAQFAQLSPAQINDACAAWSQLASSMGTHADSMLSHFGQPLHQAWQSATSPDVQQHLQTAQATAQALANQCMQMARATDYAYQYATWYQQHVPGTGMSQGAEDDGYAQEHLVKFMDRYNEVIAYCLPDSVQADFVQTNPSAPDSKDKFTPASGPGAHVGGVPSTGGGAGAVPAGHIPSTTPLNTANLPGHHTPSSTGTNPLGPGTVDGSYPGGPNGTGGAGSTDFPALPGVDTGSSLAGLDSSAGGLGASTGGFGGAGGGVGSTGAGIGSGAGSGLSGSGLAAGAGAGTGAGGVGVVGAGGAAGGGRGMMAPMHGAGNGREEERERGTWLVEDEDVWGGTDAPPPVIGG